MLANNEKNSPTKRKIIIKRCFHRSLSSERKKLAEEVKRLEVTQAIEMEMLLIAMKNKHFHYYFGSLML